MCLAAALAAAFATPAGEPHSRSWSAGLFGEHDALPPMDAATLARTYVRAAEIPGVATLAAPDRRGLVEAAAARHAGRLLARGATTGRRHVDRLARSAAGRKRPSAVASACARHGIIDGPCAAYAGYVRRAAVLAEMLATGRPTPAELATELSVDSPRQASRPVERQPSNGTDVAGDALPEGAPAELAGRYASSLSVPGLASWPVARRMELLDAATARRRDRLAGLGPAPPVADRRAYVGRLAESALGRRPGVVRQACAHLGVEDGPCAAHRGYVRRALVLEQMLARPGATPDGLETELTGTSRVRRSPSSEPAERRPAT